MSKKIDELHAHLERVRVELLHALKELQPPAKTVATPAKTVAKKVVATKRVGGLKK